MKTARLTSSCKAAEGQNLKSGEMGGTLPGSPKAPPRREAAAGREPHGREGRLPAPGRAGSHGPAGWGGGASPAAGHCRAPVRRATTVHPSCWNVTYAKFIHNRGQAVRTARGHQRGAQILQERVCCQAGDAVSNSFRTMAVAGHGASSANAGGGFLPQRKAASGHSGGFRSRLPVTASGGGMWSQPGRRNFA